MSVKLNPQGPITMPWTQTTGATSMSGRTMAPLSLTPLPAPASSAPAVRVAVSQDPGPALDYSAFFAGRRDALLEQLSLAGMASDRGQAGTLPASQRDACVVLLRALAAAADASRSE